MYIKWMCTLIFTYISYSKKGAISRHCLYNHMLQISYTAVGFVCVFVCFVAQNSSGKDCNPQSMKYFTCFVLFLSQVLSVMENGFKPKFVVVIGMDLTGCLHQRSSIRNR